MSKIALDTLAAPIDLSGNDYIFFEIKSSRAGAFIWFGFSEDNSTWQEHAVTITTANTWQTEQYDISGIAAGSRNAVAYVRIRLNGETVPVNVDVDNIVYGDIDLMEVPADITKDIAALGGLLVDASTYVSAATSQSSASYTWAGVISDYPLLSKLLTRLQMQCRTAFWHDRGSLRMRYLPDTPSSVKTIARTQIMQGIQIITGDVAEIVNSVNALYNINNRNGRWQGHLLVTDATSITTYGTRDLTLELDFVTGATMADNLADYYIAEYKDTKKKVRLSVLFDILALEIMDDFIITHDATAIGLTTSTKFRLLLPPGYRPGSITYEEQKSINPGIIGLFAREV